MGQVVTPEQIKCEKAMGEIMESCKRYNVQIVPMIQFIGAGVANFGFHVVPVPVNVPDL